MLCARLCTCARVHVSVRVSLCGRVRVRGGAGDRPCHRSHSHRACPGGGAARTRRGFVQDDADLKPNDILDAAELATRLDKDALMKLLQSAGLVSTPVHQPRRAMPRRAVLNTAHRSSYLHHSQHRPWLHAEDVWVSYLLAICQRPCLRWGVGVSVGVGMGAGSHWCAANAAAHPHCHHMRTRTPLAAALQDSRIDLDGDGEITTQELLDTMDADGDGQISLQEFFDAVDLAAPR